MKRILIIEDNHDVRENLAEILNLSGYATEEAENGKIGVQKVKDYKPDLIICDVMMPELDGFGVLRILNRNPDFMHIPFMFLTAKAENSDFRKGMGLGADDYITKPFDDVELLDAIEIRLKKSENLEQIGSSDHGLRQFYDAAKAEKQLENLSKDREIRKFHKKDTIYEIGQYPKWLYFVVSGIVKCYQINTFGKELITQIYGPGDFFGFVPLLNECAYEDYTSAIEETEIRMIPANDFKILLFNNRDFAAKFIKMLANHADHSEKQLVDLAYSSVRKKVANALLSLKEKSDHDYIMVTREDLSHLAGTAKETVIRTLSDFKSEQIITIKDNQIKIIDPLGLKNMPQ